MATEQEILIKSNSADAAAVPTSLKKKEVAANLLDRSLFGSDGESVFRFYEHPTKYFNEYGFANNALKLGGFLPTYFQKALESGVNIKTINGQNILGAGNLIIQGGSAGSDNIFVWQIPEDVQESNDLVFGTVTTEEYEKALNAEILVVKIAAENASLLMTRKAVDIDDSGTSVVFIATLIDGAAPILVDVAVVGFSLIDGVASFYLAGQTMEIPTQFKTINGESIIGEGNINIEGGAGGGGNTENLVTKQEVIDNEEVIANALIQHNDKIKKIEDRFPNYPTNEEIANIKQNLDNTIIDNEEVIANALNDINTRVKAIEEPSILTISGASIILRSGQYYIHGEDVDALDISFENQKSTILSHYMLQFTTSSIGCTLSLPDDVKWVNGTTPTINGGKTYQLSILNNFAICVEYE